MKKGWLIGCGVAGIVGLGVCSGVAVLVYGVFSITQPVVDASDEFLGLLGRDKIAEAYASTAAGFRAQHDEQSFAFAVKQLGLTKYSSATWTQRSIRNQVGKTDGTVTDREGATKPITLNFVSEDGKWKVASVNYGGADLAAIKFLTPIPPDAELREMTLASLLDFNQAVQAKDFTPFYEKLADIWKKETTAEQLEKAFQEFIDKKINIGVIKDVAPTFDPAPAMTAKGDLIVGGQYPTQPLPVHFRLQYLHERGAWRLTAIRVNIGKK